MNNISSFLFLSLSFFLGGVGGWGRGRINRFVAVTLQSLIDLS